MASGIAPEGEGLRRAMRWLSDRRQEDPAVPRQRLIEEAAVRFDLSPVEVQFLYDNWK
jgi:hypothetical protein